MASIYKSTNQSGTVTYFGSIYVNGTRYRKKLGHSRASALKALKEWEFKILFNQDEYDTEQTILKARISFLKQIELQGVSYKYLQVLSYVTRKFMEYGLESAKERTSDFPSLLAQEYIVIRAQSRISHSSLNKEIQILRRFFNHCIQHKWARSNPFSDVRLFKIVNKERYYFTDNDLNRIDKHAGKFKLFYDVLLHTGIRPTDAFRLQKKAIKGRYLHIQMNKVNEPLIVPLNSYIYNSLKVILKDIYDVNGLLFPMFTSERQRNNARKLVQGLFTPAFVQSNTITLHTFRHTFAHRILDKGAPKEVLQALLGHKSIRTTEMYANWIRIGQLEKWV